MPRDKGSRKNTGSKGGPKTTLIRCRSCRGWKEAKKIQVARVDPRLPIFLESSQLEWMSVTIVLLRVDERWMESLGSNFEQKPEKEAAGIFR